MKLIRTLIPTLLLFTAPSGHAQTDEAQTRLAVDELRNFARVFEQIRQAYVEDVSDQKLFEMAIWGMLSELDPHSELLTSRQQSDLRDAAEGRFSGIGVELTMRGNNLTIVSPLDNSPAAKAGILAGDVIRRINGTDISENSFRQSLLLLDGELGETVNLTIDRADSRDALEFELVRERIARQTVSSRVILDEVGYLRINQFSDETGRDFRAELGKLLQENSALRGLIVDLRNNPGGLLRSAVEVSDTLLSGGLVVSTRGRIEEANQSYFASAAVLAEGMPVVVLINQGSASAAEIVAGAWQDRGRALILGETSFGKGSVQEVLSIDDSLAIKLTVARYYTPSGRSIQAQGIYPDIRVDSGTLSWQTEASGVTEADLARALPGDTDSTGPEFIGLRDSLTDIRDAQLAMAVTLLRGKHLMETQQ